MEIRADLTANVWKVEVSEGDEVTAGQTVAILESMKMEIPVETPVDGVVRSIAVQEGGMVHEGDAVVVVDPA
jgi:biotin carboxyl carrier protein